MPFTSQPTHNRILGSLSAPVQQRMFPHLEFTLLDPGAVLHEPYEPLWYAYFPVDSIISVLCETRHGEAAEYSVVGNDGMFGITALLGGLTTPRRAVVQCGGPAYRLREQVLKEEFTRFGELHDRLLRYIQSIFVQTSQIAACNRHHSVEQQLCRWLLFFLDRSRTGRINMTHQRIASMLGVRREGVTLAARRLQKQGVISYHRGDIEVLDRTQLESLSCECYGVVQNETERLLNCDKPVARTA